MLGHHHKKPPNPSPSPPPTPPLPKPYPVTAEQIAIGAAVVGGISTALLLNVGPSWVDKGLAFMAGAVPSAIVADWAAHEDSVNIQMAEQSLGFLTDWPVGPITFGLVFLGTTLVINLTYLVLIMPEVEVILDLLPVIRGDKISVAIVVLGLAATLLFTAIAGWTIEVIQYILNPTAPQWGGQPPQKPGGRARWGMSKLPKDLVYLLFAAPIGVFQTAEYAISHKSIIPLFFTPVKIAVDQWSRLGDVILDLYVPEEILVNLASKYSKFFGDLIETFTGVHSDQQLVEDAKHYGKPPTSNLSGSTTTDPTWQIWLQLYGTPGAASAQFIYPLLYSEGDNDP